MYSLPINPYSDYWRKTQLWGKYMGGTAVIIAGTLAVNSIDNPFPLLLSGQGTPEIGSVTPPVAAPLPVAEPAPVSKVSVNIKIEDHVIPYETEYVETTKLPAGMSEVQKGGEQGLERREIRTVSIAGEEDYDIVYQFELKAPKKRVVMQNTQPPPQGESLDTNQWAIAQSFPGEATAYTYTGNRTATGVEPRVGLIAVDPDVIPLGSTVYVEGYGYAVAADTGGAIKGQTVDVFFNTFRECINWGRRQVQIYVLQAQ